MHGPDISKLKLEAIVLGDTAGKQLLKVVRKMGHFPRISWSFCSLFEEENNDLWKIYSHIFDSFHILNSLQQLRCLGKWPRTNVLAKFSLLSFKILGLLYMGCNTRDSLLFHLYNYLTIKKFIYPFNIYWGSSFLGKVQLTMADSSGCAHTEVGGDVPVSVLFPPFLYLELVQLCGNRTWQMALEFLLGGGVGSCQGNLVLLFVS